MLYIKNNKLFINILLIILMNLYNLINNISVSAIDNTNKYQNLEVELIITVKSEYKDHIKDLNELIISIKKDLLIYNAKSETKLTITRIKNLHHRGMEEIINDLESFGYYEKKIIENKLINIKNNHWLASYKVEIGPAVKIKKIDIDILGEINKSQITIIKHKINKYLKINSNLIHGNYEKTKQFILNNLHENGFLNAQIKESNVLINLQENSANIVIIVDAKQQYYLGKVIFKSDLYPSEFLNKYIPFKEHDLYSMDNLMQLKNNLLNSGLFAKTRIDTVNVNNIDNNVMPVIVRLYHKSKHKYFGSFGFGSDTGFRGSLGYIYRLPNKPGNIMNINLSIAKKRNQAVFDYSFLGENPMAEKYNFGLMLQKEKIKIRSNKNLELYFQKSIDKNNFKQIWKLSFLKEYFKELPESPKQHANFLLPTIKFTWLDINDFHFAESKENTEQNQEKELNLKYGNKLTFTTKFGVQSLLSSTNLLQFIINETWIKHFIYDLRIIFKTTIGTTVIKDLKKFPLSLRFFAGGDHSIRGFGYNTLGPVSKDLNNNIGVIGGKHLFFTSIELEKPITKYPQLALACFLDAGNAVNNFYRFTSTKLAIGAGLGVSYSTSIGALKFYLAKPIKQPKLNFAYKKHLRIHLNFTTDL